MEYRSKQKSIVLIGLDFLSAAIGFVVAYWLMRDVTGLLLPKYALSDLRAYPALLALSFFIAEFFVPSTSESMLRRWNAELSRVLRFIAVFAIVFAGVLLLVKSELVDSRYLYVTVFALTAPLMFTSHRLYRRVMLSRYTSERVVRLTGVVTTLNQAETVLARVAADPSRRVSRVMLFGDGPLPETISGVPCRDARDMVALVRAEALDELLLVLPYEGVAALTQAVGEIESMGAVIHLHVPLLDLNSGLSRSTGTVAGYPVVSVAEKVHDPSLLALKRIVDILGGLVGLALTLPILLFVAPALLIESPGGLFFSQTRIGRNGRPFRIYKVRSMYADAEARKAALEHENEMSGPMFKMKNDPRITKVGRFIRKTSIDELPQFFNVLKGDMSLVGPRPPLPDEFAQYLSRYKRRLSMRPGITGFWQVNGRNRVPDFDEIVRMDLQYIDEWSPRLDVAILIKTVAEVLKGSGE